MFQLLGDVSGGYWSRRQVEKQEETQDDARLQIIEALLCMFCLLFFFFST